MPTVKDILAYMRFERTYGSQSGSCFGVTDPTRLREAFSNQPAPTLRFCKGCQKKAHRCKKHFPVQLFKNEEDKIVASRKVEVGCDCPSCKEVPG